MDDHWQKVGMEGRTEPIRVRPLTGAIVLLVEDDDRSREALELLLVHLGAAVFSAATVAEGLHLLDRSEPTVLISDIGLPGGEDGCDLVRRIRRREDGGGGHLPAIAVSGFPPRETRHRARTAGFDAYLTKPLDVDALVATVQRLAVP
jgi:CheY-like chemotaxis protein